MVCSERAQPRRGASGGCQERHRPAGRERCPHPVGRRRRSGEDPDRLHRRPAPLVEAVTEVTGAQPGEANVESVGPTFGAQIAQRALIALVVFIGAVILYIGWRLEFKMGVTAIAALFHDMIVTVGIYALFGIDVTPATVVSILTILGYSLYDSVVVFDQIKENERELTTAPRTATSSTSR